MPVCQVSAGQTPEAIWESLKVADKTYTTLILCSNMCRVVPTWGGVEWGGGVGALSYLNAGLDVPCLEPNPEVMVLSLLYSIGGVPISSLVDSEPSHPPPPRDGRQLKAHIE